MRENPNYLSNHLHSIYIVVAIYSKKFQITVYMHETIYQYRVVCMYCLLSGEFFYDTGSRTHMAPTLY